MELVSISKYQASFKYIKYKLVWVKMPLLWPSLASCYSSEVLNEWETQRPIGWLACIHLLPPALSPYSSDVSKKRGKKIKWGRQGHQGVQSDTEDLHSTATRACMLHLYACSHVQLLQVSVRGGSHFCQSKSTTCIHFSSLHVNDQSELHSLLARAKHDQNSVLLETKIAYL